jgi:hypothetical protein
VHTGDVGFQDKEGLLFIRGEVKGVIIAGGQNARRHNRSVLMVDGVAPALVKAPACRVLRKEICEIRIER